MRYIVWVLVALCALVVQIDSSGAAHGVAATPEIGGCQVFPADNIWNTPVDTLPRDLQSDAYVASIGASAPFHPDFGANPTYGIPYVVVPATQPLVPVTFGYADESDPGPYPIPRNAPIEGGAGSRGDRHVLVVQQGTCRLYELWSAYPQPDGSWLAGSGAVFDLAANGLRPASWTSADAAGLPILPGLVRREEVLAGEIAHALRFTAPRTRRSYVWPARHQAGASDDPSLPPMGQRFRLKASVDISSFHPQNQVILRALQKYGMMLADNGSAWFVSGATDAAWDDEMLDELKQLRGSDFEAVDVSSLQVDPDSGQARSVPHELPARLYLPLLR